MRRRSLLASLAAGTAVIAGCQTRAGDRTTTDRTTNRPTTDPTTEPPTTGDGGDNEDDREVGQWPGELASTVTLETQPRVLSLFPTEYRSRDGGELEVAFTQTATADHPTHVEVTLTNANDFSNVFRLDDHPPLDATPAFTAALRRTDVGDAVVEPPQIQERVYLAPLPDQSLPTAAPEIHRGSNGAWRLVDDPDGRWLPATRRLDAGESVTVAFAAVGGPTPEDRVATRPHELSGGGETLTLAAWNPEQPGPETDSRFAGESFPALPGDDETGQSSVSWFHEATAEQAVFLRPSVEQTDLPSTVTFSLVNHATEPATGNPYYWELFELADCAWHKITPWAYPLPVTAVPPGDAYDYRFRFSNGESLPCSNGNAVGWLGGGTYAFKVGINVRDRTHAAVFELDAKPVEVTPTGGVEATRDGDTVTVTSPKWDAGHGRGEATVERAASADRVLVPESAARRDVYRNTLPFFDAGVSTVVLRTSDSVARSAQDAGVLRYRGDAYSFSGVELTE
ncbi:MAG: hypothetical protein ABEJ88_01080 [Halobacterium sp.]